MAPTVILIRHAQAEHNATHKQNYALADPPLTPLGFGPQCQELSKHLQEKLPLAKDIGLIVVSPLRRTLQTAQQGLGFLIEKGVPVVLLAELQENSEKPCDTGSSIDSMKEEWPQLDWDTVHPWFPRKVGIFAFNKESVTERGTFVRRWLRERPEKVIAVVSHAGFLRVGVSYRQYENADYRIFDFAEKNDPEAKLVEWELTESNGGGLGKSAPGVYGWESQPFPTEGVSSSEATEEKP